MSQFVLLVGMHGTVNILSDVAADFWAAYRAVADEHLIPEANLMPEANFETDPVVVLADGDGDGDAVPVALCFAGIGGGPALTFGIVQGVQDHVKVCFADELLGVVPLMDGPLMDGPLMNARLEESCARKVAVAVMCKVACGKGVCMCCVCR